MARPDIAPHRTTPKDRAEAATQLVARVVRARRDGVLSSKLRRHAVNFLSVPFSCIRAGRALPLADRTIDLAPGFDDHRGSGGELRCSDAALDRLVSAYRSAMRDRCRDCPPALEVRGLWSEWLDRHYQPLRRMLDDHDVAGLRALLENLHREPMSTGVGGTIDDVNRVPRPMVPAYYRSLWCRYRNLLGAARPDWDDVASPLVGNPHGVRQGGRLLQVETLRHAHHATQMLALLQDVDHPCILEIGGGLGGQAYQCISLSPWPLGTYTIVDLPEVAALAAYCLMAALGEGCVRLYGETAPNGDPPTVEVLPHWCIARRADSSADLVFNAHSFSEMDGLSAGFYLGEVERVCRGVFFHVNHETRFRYRLPDGKVSQNRTGSEMVPCGERFTLVARHPQAFRRPENRANTGFAYVYRRREAGLRPVPPATGLKTAHRRSRILFLSSSAELYGSDRALLELAGALGPLGHAVTVAVPQKGPLSGALGEAGIPCFAAPLFVVDRSLAAGQLWRLFRAVTRPSAQMLELVRTVRPDIVYSNTSHVMDGPAIARAFAVPHLWHLREIERIAPAARRLYGRWLVHTSARVLAISDAVRRSYYPGTHPGVSLVPDGVDVEHFRPAPLSLPASFSAQRPLRLLSLGRITEWKGQHVAVRAARSLVGAGVPVRLRVVGTALTGADGAYRDRLLDAAGGCPEVTIEAGVPDPRRLYQWCDVLVHTAVHPEPFGRVLVEAMASGRAVVASDDGGPREIVQDGIDGRLVTPGRPQALAGVLRRMAGNPATVAKLASAATGRASTFSVRATADAVHEVLAHVQGASVLHGARG